MMKPLIGKNYKIVILVTFVIMSILCVIFYVSIDKEKQSTYKDAADMAEKQEHIENGVMDNDIPADKANEINQYINRVIKKDIGNVPNAIVPDTKSNDNDALDVDDYSDLSYTMTYDDMDDTIILESYDDIDWDAMEYNDMAYYMDDDGNIMSVRKFQPMTPQRVSDLEGKIKDKSKFDIKKTITLRVDGEFVPCDFYFYEFNSDNKKVYNASGVDITNDMPFDVKSCSDSLDFLKSYLLNEGMPIEFMTQDTTHTDAGKDTYSFASQDNPIVKKMADYAEISQINDYDIKYSLNYYETEEDSRLDYISLELHGLTKDGKQIDLYLDYSI